MNEQHFAYKIRQHLNLGLRTLRPEIAGRLRLAREKALSHQKQTVRQAVLATSGVGTPFRFDCLDFRQGLAALALALVVLAATFWVADQRIDELGAIDSALLANDLPIGVFADKGFAAWLNGASPE